MSFLPISKKDMEERGWDSVHFVFVTGDAYVDHPTFGPAILSRLLESYGFRVAILAQPDINKNEDFMRFGAPELGFLVSSGNIDSMVAHYTVAKRRRKEDAYSPGKKIGLRPDRAVTVYTKKLKELYPACPVIIGGLEASLRRFAHYDYWSDSIRPSILVESGADLLSYGMGEKQTVEIAQRLLYGEYIGALTDIKGTCYLANAKNFKPRKGSVECPSFENVKESKKEYAVSCRKEQDEQDAVRGKTLIQKHGDKILVQNPPMPPLCSQELDKVYELPYERTYHPIYESLGGVPAIEEVQFSITQNRGCFGACNFCSLAFHQGRAVTSRSEESIIREATILTSMPNFKGYIHDVGGPSANFRNPSCKKQEKDGLCAGKKCLAPTPCPALIADHREYVNILRKLRELPKVKKVFIRSGIRYDYLMADPDDTFFRELVKYHVSGQLKVAPEHCAASVLDKMGKPHIESYLAFQKKFFALTKSAGKEQYLVPYLMSSHPGSTIKDAVDVALFIKNNRLRPEQVQDFYPTPGTISTCMYYTGLDPYTMKPVYVPKTPEDKAMQRALLQYFVPKNKALVIKALKLAHREDLIGFSDNCLVRPETRGRSIQTENRNLRPKKRTVKDTPKRNPRKSKKK